MCGIITGIHFGKKAKEPVNQFIIDQYESQFERGVKGFGIVRITPGTEVAIDRATEPVKMMLDLYLKQSPMIMLHHRMPTSTDNKLDQTHPIEVEHESLKHHYLVIHNGVISNDDELRTKHKELGFDYTTEYSERSWSKGELHTKWNDSESFAVELVRFIEGQSNKIDVYGSAAFVALQCDKDWLPLQLFFGRNDRNPLNLVKTRDRMYLSSTGPGNEVDPFVLYSLNLAKPEERFTRRKFTMKEPAAFPSVSTGITQYGSHYGGSIQLPTHQPGQHSLPVRTDLSFPSTTVEMKRKSPDELLDLMPESPTEIIPDGMDNSDEAYETNMESVQDYLDLFYTEIDDFQSLPDVNWYAERIKEILQRAHDEAASELAERYLQHHASTPE